MGFNPPPDSGITNNHNSAPQSTWKAESRDVTSFSDLSPSSKAEFLLMVGYSFGVRVDSHSGPKRTPFQVASVKTGKHPYIHEATEVYTEVVTTQNEREVNYAHEGWSLSASLPASPWVQSRVANGNQPNRSEPYITKRIIVNRLRVDILLEDLAPTTAFESAVRDALAKTTRFEKFQTLYRLFERWGDVIPLTFDVGSSLAISDLQSNQSANPIDMSSLEKFEITAHRTAKVSTQGVNLSALQNGVGSWIYSTEVPTGQWAQVRVTKIASVVSILPKALQTQLLQLHSSAITYQPSDLQGNTSKGHTFDDTPHALKTIKSVTVNCDDNVNSICVVYWDGSTSVRHGGSKGSLNQFDLGLNEYISEVHIWKTPDVICSIQFFTNYGRTSQCYGGIRGTPIILNSTGGVLTAFAGKVKNDVIYQLQGIWRHDMQEVKYCDERAYSEYQGCNWGHRFNDLPLLKYPNVSISKIKVRYEARIIGIQFIYSHQDGERKAVIEGPYHGGKGGKEGVFELTAGEWITMVRGRTENNVVQLCFVTNLGRTSSVFGGGEGTEFTCQAPWASNGKAMRLYSICGGSGTMLDGLVFAWAAV